MPLQLNVSPSVTEVCFESALGRAIELDKYLAQTGNVFGPLHGIPTTLKDQFNLAGFDTTIGYVGRAFQPAKENAALVKMLYALGAVVLAKSNLPQSIMWCETENPLWGLTTNPQDSRYTPGGSTGGEAVLIASGASVLGFGTDIGGSIRIPAHMMGIYGFKPTVSIPFFHYTRGDNGLTKKSSSKSSRLPYYGVPVSTEGQEHVPSSVGPMASSLDTIFLSMKSLIELQPWTYDARCTPITWQNHAYEEVLGRPLVFAILTDDGIARPHPPVTRVLQQVVNSLRSAGHEIVDWTADLHLECVQVMDEYYTADGGEDIRKAVEAGGEPLIPHVDKLINRGKPISVFEYWQLNKRKSQLQQAYLEKWQSIRAKDGRQVDAVIMPPMPHTAVPHGRCKWVGYTKVWNLLDYTALVIPAGKVSAQDLEAPWDFEPRGEIDKWSLDLWQEQRDGVDLELPVGLQIIGRRFEEEKVLGIGKVVESILCSRGN